MILLALLRHGHTAWNREGRIQGRTDKPLDKEARQTLSMLRLPAPWDHADTVASPLRRARDTAALLTGQAPQIVPDLIEMDWGTWEGRTRLDLHVDPACDYRDVEHWGWYHAPPGGESPSDVQRRVVPWASGLQRDTLAVCHIGVMRVLLAQAHGWHFDGPAPFRIKRDRLYLIEISDNGWRPRTDPVRLIGVTRCG